MEKPRSDNSFLHKSQFKWDDVKIVKQYDGKPPILNLKYTPDYEELMDYFRGILQSGEISERAYEITGFVLELLCSNYNAWYLRQQCLEQLTDKLTYQQELQFCNKMREGNEKVFQIWDHRKYVIEKLNDCTGEIEFLEEVMEDDNKNYHAWSYRIWLCEKFDLFEIEWDIVQRYFPEDIRNNSAWNYRFFLFKNKFYKPEQQNIKEELEFTFKQIEIDPENEASWNYLQGFFQNYEFKSLRTPENLKSELNVFAQKITQHKFQDFPQVNEFALKILKDHKKNRFVITMLIDIHLTSQEIKQQDISQALVYCEYLSEDVDKIRTNYWQWYAKNIREDFNHLIAQEQPKNEQNESGQNDQKNENNEKENKEKAD